MSDKAKTPLHGPALHESAARHVTGKALYVDDLPPPHGMLLAQIVPSTHAHGRITRRDATRARAVPGVHAVLFASDVPGHNLVGPVLQDEPLLAEDEVLFAGHSVALVVAETADACRQAASLVEVEVEELPAVLSIAAAIEQRAYMTEPHVIRRGDVDAALAGAALRVEGELESGAQDHFYLETQAALAIPEEDGTVRILSSTQHPTEVQHMAAHVLGVGSQRVACEVPRMGGAFGGKESQASQFGALAALAAHHTGRPVKLRLDRDQDMCQTGKRHPTYSRYEAGFDEDGRIVALRAEVFADGGFSRDLSAAILDRAMFHLDNAYFIPNVDLTGVVCRTNLPSNTAFRGFGGPQGILVVEDAINRASERLGLDPAVVRAKSFYGDAPRNRTPYGQEVRDNRLERIHDELMASSEYAGRRAAIAHWNARSPHTKRGIAFQPVKFGISFTLSFLNQAGALVLVYTDGTVQLNHGGTEMGQGLHTKMMAVCAHELGVPMEHVRVMATATDKVPNTSPTAASSGADLNGQAVKDACTTLRDRMRPTAARLLGLDASEAHRVRFEDGAVYAEGAPERTVTFAGVAKACWLGQVPLLAAGYYSTPGIAYDHAKGRGTPFYYFAYGGAVTEVEVSGLTGEHRVLRVDILHDVGDSLLPEIDRGQVEGAFIQGLGWLTSEEVLFDARGHLLTHGPSTYKVPAIGDAPVDFRVALLDHAPQDGVIHGSKAVGEPPLMLAISAVTALRHAIAAFGPVGQEVPLHLPATPESILRAIEQIRTRATLPDAAAESASPANAG